MENSALLSQVSLMLPSNILSRFVLVKVESTDDTISIHLDEKIPSDCQSNPNIESKGFLSPVTVRDFPILDKAVNLIVRRRRCLDLHIGKCFILPYNDIKSEKPLCYICKWRYKKTAVGQKPLPAVQVIGKMDTKSETASIHTFIAIYGYKGSLLTDPLIENELQ